jgi:phosphoglycerol transferase MdoB-like AlkP superfamily enzyme
MGESNENGGYGITVFKPGTPQNVKVRGIIFFIAFCLIILVQAFYWMFANKVLPIVLGMPFGMFFIVLFITIEFVALVILYFLESSEASEGGDV